MRVGMMVCFDWAFPEVARALALKGADLIGHPANLVLTYCQQAMVTRCIENLVFAVTANRYGTEERPHGELTLRLCPFASSRWFSSTLGARRLSLRLCPLALIFGTVPEGAFQHRLRKARPSRTKAYPSGQTL